MREHRLYQADWLLRFYGFGATELTTPEQPNLDLQLDPKLAWALRIDRDDLRRRVAPPERQLDLFEVASSAQSGEV